MNPEIKTILYSEEDLSKAVSELGNKLTSDYEGRELVLVAVLKGSVLFFADLMRCIDLPCTIDFMAASSYGSSTVSSGKLNIKKDISCDIKGKDVLIVEDILDTGTTLSYLKDYLAQREPASIKLCTLFDKPARRKKPITADYSCFTIDDQFIVGYGLDYDEKFRKLPYVGILDPGYCK